MLHREQPCVLRVGVIGINFKTADLSLREAIARGAETLSGEKALFFSHPTILLSTCNRTEIYFSADDLAEAHSDLLALLRTVIPEPFEPRLYSYFGIDCFAHLCRVAAGLDSAILAETEIQRQVKAAYLRSSNLVSLPGSIHYMFQKALKVGKAVRRELELERGAPTLFGTIWQMYCAHSGCVNLASRHSGPSFEDRSSPILMQYGPPRDFQNLDHSEALQNSQNLSGRSTAQSQLDSVKKKKILLVGNSEINRGLAAFLSHRGIAQFTLCTQNPTHVDGAVLCDRAELANWQDYDLIVTASKAGDFLIKGRALKKTLIFDLSVPRNVDPAVGNTALLYNIEQVNQIIEQKRRAQKSCLEKCDTLVWEHVLRLARIYREKTTRSVAVCL